MERREPGLFGTLFAFGSPLLVGLLVLYEWTERAKASDLFFQTPSTAVAFLRPLDFGPLALVVLGWLGLSVVLQILAWFMNGRGALIETLGTIGRMVGQLGMVEATRLGVILNGVSEWASMIWFSVGTLLVLGWTGRAWGKLHLLSRKEAVIVTLVCFYGPVLVWVALKAYAAVALFKLAPYLQG